MFAEAVLSVFSQRYADARNQFVSHAETSSIVEKFSHLPHTLKGPKNEKLFCDIAWAGNDKADKLLVLISGVHGVEGGAGSAIQSDFLSRYRRLPADVGVVLVHALNPWGFAWASRNDDEGIDVNRNFVDFNAKLPVSGATAIWEQLEQGKTDIATIARDREQFDLLSEGQYEKPEMPYYGGKQASWSRQVIEELVAEIKPARRKQIIVLDIHSGLGPYGYGELICDHPVDSKAHDYAVDLFGATVTEPSLGNSSSGTKLGLHDYFWHSQGEHVCYLTLEFGTYGNQQMLQVLSEDQKLQQSDKVDWSDDTTLDIKHAMQDFFCPQDKQWQELVLFRGRQVIGMALDGLTDNANVHHNSR
jgi:predicted deacylase